MADPKPINAHEQLGRQISGSKTCSECGTISLRFDPPLHFEVPDSKMCGAVKPGNYVTNIPYCELVEGHEGGHFAMMEYTERWDV